MPNLLEARSFPPILGENPRVLILGSMPGQASLAAQAYYAHPRNAFWPLMGELLGFAPTAPYSERIEALKQAGVALWDVLQSCRRPGSLDANIDPGSIQPNQFYDLFTQHPSLRSVFFNGTTADSCFRRYVLPGLPAELRQTLQLTRLPSTSPAHAGMSRDEKRRHWECVQTALSK